MPAGELQAHDVRVGDRLYLANTHIECYSAFHVRNVRPQPDREIRPAGGHRLHKRKRL